MTRWPAVLVALVLWGCTTAWTRPAGVTDDQYRRDDRACTRAAAAARIEPPIEERYRHEDPWAAWYRRGAPERAYRDCMEAKGYRIAM